LPENDKIGRSVQFFDLPFNDDRWHLSTLDDERIALHSRLAAKTRAGAKKDNRRAKKNKVAPKTKPHNSSWEIGRPSTWAKVQLTASVVRLPLSPLGCQLDGLISLTATKRRSS
jgi:uncharacterized protein YdaU (DUF1376 family)